MKKIILILFLASFISSAQNKYPTNYFRSPLDISLHLSGTFGELRNNHFHAGVDIKTKRRTGFPVYATKNKKKYLLPNTN